MKTFIPTPSKKTIRFCTNPTGGLSGLRWAFAIRCYATVNVQLVTRLHESTSKFAHIQKINTCDIAIINCNINVVDVNIDIGIVIVFQK